MRGRRSSARSGPHGDRVPVAVAHRPHPQIQAWSVRLDRPWRTAALQIQFPLRLTAYAGGRFRSVRWRAGPHG